jgi:Spy/CpxP family protein refolding chaperone
MKRYLYITGAILLITAGVVGIARADHFPGRYAWCMRSGPGGFPLAFLARKLDLTEAQRAQVKSIWAAERPTVIPLVRQLLNQSSNFSAANTDGAFDEAKARATADQQAATLAQLLVERQRLISKIYNEVLTPEQRIKADQLHERMHGRVEGFLDGLEHSTDSPR